ncbi:MAG: hypothetical protein QOI82_669 [Actinomycetota bacterium]|nr:hypothetical protein [Actinomycetota bacterium]
MDTEGRRTTARPDASLLAGLDLQTNTMQTVLLAVAGMAVDAVTAAEAASVTLLMGDRPITVASTGEPASGLDETQYEQGYGPCLDAVLSQQTMEIGDMRTEARWPDFTPVAVRRGVFGSLSVPIPVVDSVAAALNVYATSPEAFADADRQSLQEFVAFAAAAIGNMHVYEASKTLVEHMRIAAESRAVIDQARGILMAEHHCGAEEAFDILRRTSQHSNRKIRDLAFEIVERTGRGLSEAEGG